MHKQALVLLAYKVAHSGDYILNEVARRRAKIVRGRGPGINCIRRGIADLARAGYCRRCKRRVTPPAGSAAVMRG